MFSAFRTFGRMGAPAGRTLAQQIAAMSPSLWLEPSLTNYQDSSGMTLVTQPGGGSADPPVGKALDLSGLGNHAIQSTSTARPKLSARVNLLTYSEDLTNANWAKNGVAADSATLIRVTTAGGSKSISQVLTLPACPVKIRITAKAGNSDQFAFGLLGGSWLGSASIVSGPGTLMAASGLCGIVGLTSSTTVIDISVTVPSAGTYTFYCYPGNWYADAPVGATVEILKSQLNLGSTALPYQRVGAASDYDTAGFPLYWKFDGTDDALATGNIDLTGTDKVTVVAGVMKTDDTARIVAELSANMHANAGSFYLVTGADASVVGHTSASRGAAATNANQAAYAEIYSGVDLAVITATHDIAGDLSRIRRNGVYKTDATGDKGAGNFGNYPLYIGARGGTSVTFNSNIYALLIFPRILTDAEIATVERYVAQLSGVTL